MLVDNGLNGFIVINDNLFKTTGKTTDLTSNIAELIQEELGLVNRCYMLDDTHLEVCLFFINNNISWPTAYNCQKYLKDVLNIDSYIKASGEQFTSICLTAYISKELQEQVKTYFRMKGY